MENMVSLPDTSFWRGRRVLLTGHTGFKGAWAALWLERLGAAVTGLALPPEPGPSMFESARVWESCVSQVQDIRDGRGLAEKVAEARPQIVLHLAAQPLVRRSLADPTGTFETNVLGTLNLLNGLRDVEELQAVLIVTSDKVYANDGSGRPMKEDDRLGGTDPYSASKAACELSVSSFVSCFFADGRAAVATARAGNVIGGGDFAADRVVPDCVRAMLDDRPLVLRHPHATRPWQHVLDCLCGYLLFAERLAKAPKTVPRALNFGPKPGYAIPVEEMARSLLSALGAAVPIEIREPERSVEAARLDLDSTRARRDLRWQDRLTGTEAIRTTAEWYRLWHAGEDMRAATLQAIEAYQLGQGD